MAYRWPSPCSWSGYGPTSCFSGRGRRCRVLTTKQWRTLPSSGWTTSTLTPKRPKATWRGFFQRFNGQLRSLTGARSPLPDKVVFGSDDWLYKGGLQLDIYRGKRRFTPEELRRVVGEITARRDSIHARGGRYYLAVAPLKHHVYPRFLPGHVRPLNREFATRQLYAALEEAGLPTVDLHTPLQDYAAAHPPLPLDTNHLQTTDLYYRTDHHWTVRAGLRFVSQPGKGLTLAQIAGIDRADQDHYITVSKPWTAARQQREDLKAPPRFPYPNNYVKHYRQRDTLLARQLPSLFVTRESFGENLVQPLSEHFGSAFYLFDEWEHQLNLEEYDREGGDVYLQLIWEGFLFNLLDVPDEDGKW